MVEFHIIKPIKWWKMQLEHFHYLWGLQPILRLMEKIIIIPMVIEEPSVIAAASKGAKIARIKGGFEASANEFLQHWSNTTIEC